MNLDIIHKSGAWFSYGDQRIGQGRENTRNYLKENPEVAREIEALVRKELLGRDSAAPADEAPKPEEDLDETDELLDEESGEDSFDDLPLD